MHEKKNLHENICTPAAELTFLSANGSKHARTQITKRAQKHLIHGESIPISTPDSIFRRAGALFRGQVDPVPPHERRTHPCTKKGIFATDDSKKFKFPAKTKPDGGL